MKVPDRLPSVMFVLRFVIHGSRLLVGVGPRTCRSPRSSHHSVCLDRRCLGFIHGILKKRLSRIPTIKAWLSRLDSMKRLRFKLAWTHQDVCVRFHHADDSRCAIVVSITDERTLRPYSRLTGSSHRRRCHNSQSSLNSDDLHFFAFASTSLPQIGARKSE